MPEPVQNCFTFYCADGKSAAHNYCEQNVILENKENSTHQEETNAAQQSLALSSTYNTKKPRRL